MNPFDEIENSLTKERSGVYTLDGHEVFQYSDGADAERYLNRVLLRSRDLSSRSEELEAQIKDWPSEYHLSRKRAKLLTGFKFDRRKRVLEVGGGCGAITRYLGESFDHVLSIEGSISRARLARLRCNDLQSVAIVCAPFQELKFRSSFDIIFCIGVFEYSSSFIQSQDPYRAALSYFSSLLSEDGILILAIENQFGLKYFLGAREDHLGTRFEGIEGYRRRDIRVRTFGKVELHNIIGEFFNYQKYFYPFPDYKLPDFILTEEFLHSGLAGELVARSKSRDYFGNGKFLWDEFCTIFELSRNRALDFFSNSLLVAASKKDLPEGLFPQSGILHSSGRVEGYDTVTRIFSDSSGTYFSDKAKSRHDLPDPSPFLRSVQLKERWVAAPTVFTEILLLGRNSKIPLKDLFQPTEQWIRCLRSLCFDCNGRLFLSGEYLDAIWANSFRTNQDCRFIDLEWRWHDNIPLNVLVIRSIYDFLCRIEDMPVAPRVVRGSSGVVAIRRIAETLNVRLTQIDFDDFVQLESQVASAVFGTSQSTHVRNIRWFFLHRSSRRFTLELFAGIRRHIRRFSRFFGLL